MHKLHNSNLTEFIKSCKIPLAICDLNLVFLDVNEPTINIFGFPKEELIGNHINIITCENDLSFNLEKYRQLVNGEIDSYSIKRRYKTKQGDVILGKISASLLNLSGKTYVLGILDVEINENLISGGFHAINKILSLNPDIHYILNDVTGELVYENTSVLGYFGYDKNDLNGLSLDSFLESKVDLTTLQPLYSKNKDYSPYDNFIEAEFKIKTKVGEWKWFRSRSIKLIKNDDLDVIYTYSILQDITRSKEIENELNFQYEFLEDIANLIPDVVFVFKNNPFKGVFSNLKNRTFLGYTNKEWSKLEIPQPHEDYKDYLQKCLNDLKKLKHGEVIIHEIPFISKSGETRWLASKSKLFRKDEVTGETQILSVVADIQDYRAAIEKLKVSQNTNNAIIKAIPDLILMVNKQGIYLNSFSGYNLRIDHNNEVIGKHVFDIIKDEGVAKNILANIKRCIDEDKLIDYEFQLFENNKIVYFSNFYSKLNDNEAMILIRDISKRKIAENELSNKISLLSKQNKKLEEFIAKNTELERFAYILSHDLKEPLRSITAISSIISKEIQALNKPKLNQLMEHLTSSSERMNLMIEGVLEYSRTSNELIDFSEVKMNDVIKDVFTDLEVLIKEKNIKVIVDDLTNILGSHIQMRQLFQNLINNAAKFSVADNPYIHIGNIHEEDEEIFFVKDNGIGIDEKFRETVFKMFRRLNSGSAYEGQGLGLSICKKIVDRHDGNIWIEENKDAVSGSIFYISLPKKKRIPTIK